MAIFVSPNFVAIFHGTAPLNPNMFLLFLRLNFCRPIPCPEPVKLQIYTVGFKEYERHCYDLSQLRETCEYGTLCELHNDPSSH